MRNLVLCIVVFSLTSCASGRVVMEGNPVLPDGAIVAVATYVYRFESGSSRTPLMKAPEELNAIMEDYLRQMGYITVDRNLIDSVMKEQKLGQTGAVAEKQAAEVGKLAGAQYILATMILMGQGGTQSLTTRMIEVETAQIVSSAGMQMDEFESNQETFWNAVFFKP